MNIYQNDQYYLKIKPIFNDEPVDNTCDEMIIKLGDVVKKKSLNELIYDEETQCWLFPLTIDHSSSVEKRLRLQAWFSFGDAYYSTPVKIIDVGTSIILKSEVQDD